MGGGYGDENPFFYSEREEALEILAKDFHQANYGSAGAVIVGSGVSDELLEKIAAQLQLNTYGNASNSADGFRAGELRIRKQGNSVAVIGADVTGMDAAAVAEGAAIVDVAGAVDADVQALSFAASSAA